MSPARTGRLREASGSPLSSQCRICRAMRSAKHHCGRRRPGPFGERLPCRDGIAVLGLFDRPDFDQPGLALAMGEMADRLAVGGQARRAIAVGENKIDGLQHGARAAERQGQRRLVPRLVARRGRGRHSRGRWRRTGAARRPGSRRSTASRRPPRTSVRCRSSTPSPAKNSAVSARISAHCRGLVSCASSTRMWVRSASSRNSTQAAASERWNSAAVRAISPSKSSALRCALASS